MPRVDLVVRTLIKRTPRARQLEALFDVPAVEQSEREWHGDVPLDARDWNVGLIVGLSGSGKSTILRDMFAEPATLTWAGASVIEDFDRALSMKEIADMCQAVGFNTIPAWLRPYSVLSNGERFRVELARRMLEGEIDARLAPHRWGRVRFTCSRTRYNGLPVRLLGPSAS